MSRIISGVAGGLRLANVPGDNTRPTTDRVKEALFSRLETYNMLAGVRALDLFAGSGALGCEALSRGATHVDFVDHYPKAVSVVEKNTQALAKAASSAGLPFGSTRIHRLQARTYVAGYSGAPWDLVFIDPPYAVTNAELEDLLGLLAGHLAEGAVVVVERSARTSEPHWGSTLQRFAEKKYGETQLYYAEPVLNTTD